jgi:hypothetical protein
MPKVDCYKKKYLTARNAKRKGYLRAVILRSRARTSSGQGIFDLSFIGIKDAEDSSSAV